MVSFRESGLDDPVAISLVTEYFDMRAETFPAELGAYTLKFSAPSDFVPPNGVFLTVVDDDGEAIGCGGLRMITPTRFEVKHLWIQPRAQGRGLGRQLLGELEDRASALGATEVVLDTNANLVAAGALYRSSGYANIQPYNDNPNATDWFRKEIP
jgi:ribosomal protein S18 acetylase RimI-like enzyme